MKPYSFQNCIALSCLSLFNFATNSDFGKSTLHGSVSGTAQILALGYRFLIQATKDSGAAIVDNRALANQCPVTEQTVTP